jgi:hypothetical protein
MLRKTLIALTAVAALGVGSAAMAAHGGGHGGGGFGGGGHGGGGWGVGGHFGGGPGMGAMHGSWGGRVGTFSGRPFARSAFFHNRFHRFDHRNVFLFHRFHRRNAFFFGAGFAADNCWVWDPRWGWQYVCGYPYWGY